MIANRDLLAMFGMYIHVHVHVCVHLIWVLAVYVIKRKFMLRLNSVG